GRKSRLAGEHAEVLHDVADPANALAHEVVVPLLPAPELDDERTGSARTCMGCQRSLGRRPAIENLAPERLRERLVVADIEVVDRGEVAARVQVDQVVAAR